MNTYTTMTASPVRPRDVVWDNALTYESPWQHRNAPVFMTRSTFWSWQHPSAFPFLLQSTWPAISVLTDWGRQCPTGILLWQQKWLLLVALCLQKSYDPTVFKSRIENHMTTEDSHKGQGFTFKYKQPIAKPALDHQTQGCWHSRGMRLMSSRPVCVTQWDSVSKYK